MKKILYAFNVYERLSELRMNVALVKEHFGDRIDVAVYANSPHDRNRFNVEGVDIFLQGENTGHHNGTRDAFNVLVPYVDAYEYVLCTHADSFWSDLSLVDTTLSHMRNGQMEAAFLDAGPLGCMKDEKHFGYYADFFLFTPEAFKKVFPIEVELDGHEWIETEIAKRVAKTIDDEKVFLIPNEDTDRLNTNMFQNVFGTGDWMTSDHDVKRKLDKMQSKNPAYYEIMKKFE